VRKDIPWGNIAAQLVHAAGESSQGNLPNNTFAVVLSASNEQELLAIATNLQKAGIKHKLIKEPDPPFNGAAMAIGVAPCQREVVKPYLRNLPLLK